MSPIIHRSISALFCLLTICAQTSQVFAQPPDPAATHNTPATKPIPGRYIIIFKPHIENAEQEAEIMMRGVKGQVHHNFRHSIKGVAVSIPESALPGIKNNPNVESIEPDQIIQLNQVSPQNQVTWGIDRIDQVDRPLDTQYHFNYTGAGVTAFVIDTGIRADHLEFTGRVLPGYSVVADGNGTNDCYGHGTHVSGTLGGSTYGVAKSVNIVPVRVLNCTGAGTLSGVIAGMDWVAASLLRLELPYARRRRSLGRTSGTCARGAPAGADPRNYSN